MNVDYKHIADGLQKDLLEKIKEAEKLQDEVDRLNSKLNGYVIESLSNIQLLDEIKKLKKENEKLKKENKQLDHENDEQAEHYAQLKKENESLKKTTQIYSPPSPIPEDPEKEDLYKSIVTKHLPEFVEYTNFTKLTSFLCQYNLLTSDENEQLEKLTRNQKANHFYVQILGTKGKTAYTTFYHCLKRAVQDPNCHKGHIDLLELLVRTE